MQAPERQVTGYSLEDPDRLAAFGEALFQACLDGMQSALKQGAPAEAFEWAGVAARLMVHCGTFGNMASPELERGILELAQQIPVPQRQQGTPGRKRVLHVMTGAHRIFGHTTLCRKWIELDGESNRHNVILLAQEIETPDNLVETVKKQGGDIIKLDAALPPLDRARALREYAFANADVVVLHIHQDDLVAPVAFGVAGGPPVMFMNHADHSFWVGATTADMVLEIRESGVVCSTRYRGVAAARTQVLYIPLCPEVDLKADPAKYEKLRREKRAELGIGTDDPVFLTVGNAAKYIPLGRLSFPRAAEGILKACPRARLVMVGPKSEGVWAELSQKTGGRLMAVGNQTDLAPFHAMADVYLEGMPAGSFTAMLEACFAGLACVCMPLTVDPPFSTDGKAFDEIPRPVDVDEYVRHAAALAENPEERRRRGDRLREQVIELHCGEGWRSRLHRIMAMLPETHEPSRDLHPQPLTRPMRDFWLNYVYRGVVNAAEQKILAMVTMEAVWSCPDVRRKLAGNAGVLLKGADSKQKLVQAIFPTLDMSRDDYATAAQMLDEVRIFSGLLKRSLGEQPRGALRRLAARLGWVRPALLREKMFLKEVVRVWAGSGIKKLAAKKSF